MSDVDRYDPTQTYDWNYARTLAPAEVEVPAGSGEWTFCGHAVESPLGIPAGPLLNGAWILHYARLGFDVLTYKTVRSVHRECYPLPNLQPVKTDMLRGDEATVPAISEMRGSWAVSFGMPSQHPDVWRRDVESTRHQMPKHKILSVSVVGSAEPGWSLEQLAEDYAQCARWAIESGADCVETNFSCPNVSSRDGQLYQQSHDAGLVAAKVRQAIGGATYLLKIGQMIDESSAVALLDAVAPYVDALAMTNSVATTVRAEDGCKLFDGQKRGICGGATRAVSIAQTKLFSELIKRRGLDIDLIGVGGVSTADHVREYLSAGAESVHLATAAMTDPKVAIKIRQQLASDTGA